MGRPCLNISDESNSLDYGLVMDVIDFFQLSFSEAENIKEKVLGECLPVEEGGD